LPDSSCARTWARFSGVRLPRRGLSGVQWVVAWTGFWAEIAFLELRSALEPSPRTCTRMMPIIWNIFWRLTPRFWMPGSMTGAARRAEIIRDSNDYLGMSKREIWGVRAMMAVARANLR